MKSVDALRKWADGLRDIWIDPNDHSIIVTTCDDMPPSMDCVNLRERVNGILDGIEREVADMVPLPVDADGVPIHVGDMVEDASVREIVERVMQIRYTLTTSGISPTVLTSIITDASQLPQKPNDYRHHHAPTVEDVLREFVDALAEWKDGAAMMNPVETFAARLRLVGDE